MSRATKFLIIIAALILLLILSLTQKKRDFKVGEKPPDFTLKTLNGQTVTLSSLNHKVIIIHFWATYCDVCREEAPAMVSFYNMFKDNDVEILAINIEPGNRAGIKKFVKKYNWTFPVLLDPDAKVAQKYLVTGVPETLVLDRNKKLAIKRFIGPVYWMSPQFRMQIRKILEGKS